MRKNRMCKAKRYKRIPNTRIDECIRHLIWYMNLRGIKTLTCCCGHNKYPMTIVVEHDTNKRPFEIFNKMFIDRTRNFYKRDKQGYYYIPEVSKCQ